MTPPIFMRGEPRGEASLSDLHELSSAHLDIPADIQILTSTSTMLNHLSLSVTMAELTRIHGSEEISPDEAPQILHDAIEETLRDATETGNPASHIPAMRLYAGMIPGSEGGEGGEAAEARAQALRLAEAGAQAIENS